MHALRVTVLLTSFLFPNCAPASSVELREKLSGLAANVLKAAKGKPVSVGVFSEVGLPETNAGPGIEEELKSALIRLQPGSVRDDASLVVKGDYSFVKSANSAQTDHKVGRIKARIIDKDSGEELLGINVSLDLRIENPRTVATLLQVHGVLPPQEPAEALSRRIEESRQKPAAVVQGSLISTSENSAVRVEILGGPPTNAGSEAFSAKPARIEKGQAFVSLEEGEAYEIRVHNTGTRPIAFTVAIDGLDMYFFSKDRDPSTNRPLYAHSIAPAGSAVTVSGWHHQMEGAPNYHRFEIRKYGEGAASKAGVARGKIGVIHIAAGFCDLEPAAVSIAKFPTMDDSAPGEGAKSKSDGSTKSKSLETGVGAPINVNVKLVNATIHPPHEFIAIRYSR